MFIFTYFYLFLKVQQSNSALSLKTLNILTMKTDQENSILTLQYICVQYNYEQNNVRMFKSYGFRLLETVWHVSPVINHCVLWHNCLFIDYFEFFYSHLYHDNAKSSCIMMWSSGFGFSLTSPCYREKCVCMSVSAGVKEELNSCKPGRKKCSGREITGTHRQTHAQQNGK